MVARRWREECFERVKWEIMRNSAETRSFLEGPCWKSCKDFNIHVGNIDQFVCMDCLYIFMCLCFSSNILSCLILDVFIFHHIMLSGPSVCSILVKAIFQKHLGEFFKVGTNIQLDSRIHWLDSGSPKFTVASQSVFMFFPDVTSLRERLQTCVQTLTWTQRWLDVGGQRSRWPPKQTLRLRKASTELCHIRPHVHSDSLINWLHFGGERSRSRWLTKHAFDQLSLGLKGEQRYDFRGQRCQGHCDFTSEEKSWCRWQRHATAVQDFQVVFLHYFPCWTFVFCFLPMRTETE